MSDFDSQDRNLHHIFYQHSDSSITVVFPSNANQRVWLPKCTLSLIMEVEDQKKAHRLNSRFYCSGLSTCQRANSNPPSNIYRDRPVTTTLYFCWELIFLLINTNDLMIMCLSADILNSLPSLYSH